MDWRKRTVHVPDLYDAHDRGAYEQGIVAGPLVFVAGQGGLDENRNLVSPEFEPQVRQAFQNVRRALRAAQADLRDLVAMTVFLTDARYGPEFVRLRREILGGDYATSALITVDHLYDPSCWSRSRRSR